MQLKCSRARFCTTQPFKPPSRSHHSDGVRSVVELLFAVRTYSSAISSRGAGSVNAVGCVPTNARCRAPYSRCALFQNMSSTSPRLMPVSSQACLSARNVSKPTRAGETISPSAYLFATRLPCFSYVSHVSWGTSLHFSMNVTTV